MTKHKIGRLVILLFVLLLAVNISFVGAANTDTLQQAPFNTDFTSYIINQQASAKLLTPVVTDEKVLGYRPAPISMAHLTGGVTTKATPPAAYDLRSLGKVSIVQDQGSCGCCWSFGTYGSMESYLLPSESWNFSENNLKDLHGFDLGINDGGNAYMSSAYLARWNGPVTEASDPYNPTGSSSPTLPAVKHTQKVVFLPLRSSSTDNTTIKNALMTYGAVYTAFYWVSNSFNTTTSAYYYNGNSSANHAVTIVGWDDNYARTNFAKAPSGNGAFIVKNSWGTSWGKSGFFYVSYYDSKFGRSENAVFTAEPTTNYGYKYEYDPLGWVSSVGYSSTTAWMANIFTPSSAQTLQAFSTYTAAVNSTYTVYIYKNTTSGPTSGTQAYTQSGTIAEAGYNTIKLTTPVALTSGQKFSVVVKLTTPGYNYPIPFEYPVSGYSSRATGSAGQSYISGNGTSWTDMTSAYANANTCIKAFTN